MASKEAPLTLCQQKSGENADKVRADPSLECFGPALGEGLPGLLATTKRPSKDLRGLACWTAQASVGTAVRAVSLP